MNYEEMKIKLQSRLKPSRYEHSVGVAETAVFLAERFLGRNNGRLPTFSFASAVRQ